MSEAMSSTAEVVTSASTMLYLFPWKKEEMSRRSRGRSFALNLTTVHVAWSLLDTSTPAAERGSTPHRVMRVPKSSSVRSGSPLIRGIADAIASDASVAAASDYPSKFFVPSTQTRTPPRYAATLRVLFTRACSLSAPPRPDRESSRARNTLQRLRSVLRGARKSRASTGANEPCKNPLDQNQGSRPFRASDFPGKQRGKCEPRARKPKIPGLNAKGRERSRRWRCW